MPRIDKKTRDLARKLRTEPTKAESRLWYLLRRKQLQGWHFRRQHPISPHVVDFACLAARLVVEADGGQHDPSGPDCARDSLITSRGWRILRFWNEEVLQSPESVIKRILAALAPSLPSPAARGRELCCESQAQGGVPK
jgi:primosomal protein N' (replication factor Y)